MDENQRQVIRNEETVVAGEPDQTTVQQTRTESVDTTSAGGARVYQTPTASQTTVQTTTTDATTTPSDQMVSRNVAERVVDPAAEKAATVDWVSRVIWFIVGLMAVLLLFRFVLLAAGADPSAGFAQFIYGITEWMVAPFAGIFGQPITYPGAAGTGVIEFASLLAAAVYLLIGWGLTKLAQLLLGTNRTTGTVVSETERKTEL
jgi:YggT family protein